MSLGGLFREYPFLLGVGLISFLSTAGLAVIVPTLPLYLKNELHFGADFIGLLLSVYAAAETLAKTPFGILSDRCGRKRVIQGGLFLAALVPLGFAFARRPAFFVGLEVLNGLGVAAFWPVLSASIADEVREEDRASALAVVNTAYLVALGIGPALGAYADHFSGRPGAAFRLAFLLLLAALLGSFFALPEGQPYGTRPQAADSSTGPLLPPSRRFAAMLFVSFLQQFGVGLLAGTFVLYVNRQLGFSQSAIGTGLLVPAVIVALCALPLARLADRCGKVRAVALAYLVGAVVLALAPRARYLWSLVLVVALLALAYVAGAPAWLALASIFAPGGKGAALAGVSTMQSLGFILGSPVGGILYERLAPAAPFYGGSSFLFLCLALVLLFLAQPLSSEEDFGAGAKNRSQ